MLIHLFCVVVQLYSDLSLPDWEQLGGLRSGAEILTPFGHHDRACDSQLNPTATDVCTVI